jgi:hypothetical protein
VADVGQSSAGVGDDEYIPQDNDVSDEADEEGVQEDQDSQNRNEEGEDEEDEEEEGAIEEEEDEGTKRYNTLLAAAGKTKVTFTRC